MNKFLLLLIIFSLFFIPISLGSEWCEYLPIETHTARTSKDYWGGVLWNDWVCFGGSCNKNNPLIIGNNGKAGFNLTQDFNYCPNMTLSFNNQVTGSWYLTVCNDTQTLGSGSGTNVTNILISGERGTNNQYGCNDKNVTVIVSLPPSGSNFALYWVNYTCNFNHVVLNPEPYSFYAYPDTFKEAGSLPNETYPNVTYRVRLNMTNYTPSCSDTDNINKYGYFVLPTNVLAKDMNWLEQTQSCVSVDNQTMEQTHYSFINQTFHGGCKALVNYQNATLNCDLIKYNTTVGEDIPTMSVVSPINDTSLLLANPVNFAVNMSNTKCKDVYVYSTNTETNYHELTTLSSSDGYYYSGSDTLPNGTYTADLICLDGCSGSNGHNVTKNVGFSVSTEWVAGGGVIAYSNSSECVSEWVDLDKKAFCYPNPITIPEYCSNIEFKETTRVEFNNYLTSCDSDGGVFDSSQFNMSSCVPTNNCGSSSYYCNETAKTKTKTYSGALSGVVQSYSEAYVPMDCSCPSSFLGYEYGRKVTQFRVYGKITFSCDKSCVGEWICQDAYHKAYMNTNCDLGNITYCSYACQNGECVDISGGVVSGGVVDTVDSATFVFLNFLLHPNSIQKFLTAMFVSITIGAMGFAFASSHNGERHAGLLFVIMFMAGFSFFTFMGYIPSVLIILMLFGVGGYVLLKNVGI